MWKRILVNGALHYLFSVMLWLLYYCHIIICYYFFKSIFIKSSLETIQLHFHM